MVTRTYYSKPTVGDADHGILSHILERTRTNNWMDKEILLIVNNS